MLETTVTRIHESVRTVSDSGQLTIVVQVEFSNKDIVSAHTASVWVQAGSVRGDVKTLTVPPKGQTACFLLQPFRGLTSGEQTIGVDALADAPDCVSVSIVDIVSQ